LLQCLHDLLRIRGRKNINLEKENTFTNWKRKMYLIVKSKDNNKNTRLSISLYLSTYHSLSILSDLKLCHSIRLQFISQSSLIPPYTTYSSNPTTYALGVFIFMFFLLLFFQLSSWLCLNATNLLPFEDKILHYCFTC